MYMGMDNDMNSDIDMDMNVKINSHRNFKTKILIKLIVSLLQNYEHRKKIVSIHPFQAEGLSNWHFKLVNFPGKSVAPGLLAETVVRLRLRLSPPAS